MSSLKSSGWTVESCFSELNDIRSEYEPFLNSSITDEAADQIDEAEKSASLIYLSSDFDNNELKMEAFKLCEMLQYIKQDPKWYIKHQLKMAMLEHTYYEDEDDGSTEMDKAMNHAMEEILSHYDKLLSEHAWSCLRGLHTPFITNSGNYVEFPYFNTQCFDNKELLQAMVLANEIVKFPFDFMDVSKDVTQSGFDSISDYLTHLGSLNFEEYFNSQMNSKDSEYHLNIGFKNKIKF